MQVMYMMIEKHTACKNVCHLNELTAHAHLQDTHSGHVLTGDSVPFQPACGTMMSIAQSLLLDEQPTCRVK